MTIEQIAAAERDLVADTRAAIANWKSTGRVIDAARSGVLANERALVGIRAEVNNGMRPLLDLLNAEQELLNAQVTQVTAERDAYVAGFASLAAMGRAETRSLNFDRSDEHTSESQTLMRISYIDFCSEKIQSTTTHLYSI